MNQILRFRIMYTLEPLIPSLLGTEPKLENQLGPDKPTLVKTAIQTQLMLDSVQNGILSLN